MNLHHGINLGGFLSQCEHSQQHYDTFITEADIQRIAQDGFDHVRLPVDYEVFETEDGRYREEGFSLVKNIITWCKNNNLNIIIDLHKTFGYDFNNAQNAIKNNLFTSEPLARRFINLWYIISIRFGDYDNVAFELLNEVVEKENARKWNELIARTVNAIRQNTYTTPIIYGGIQWNSVNTLKLLETPNDKNIIWTFHFYEPLLFTHQKAYWVPAISNCEAVSYPDTMESYRQRSKPIGLQGEVVLEAKSQTMGIPFISELITGGVDAAKKAGVQLYCGEFGVIDKAPLDDTARWFSDVVGVFKKETIGFAVWNYKQKDFGLYDSHYERIRNELVRTWNS